MRAILARATGLVIGGVLAAGVALADSGPVPAENAVQPAGRATGVVMRRGADMTRFVVMPLGGTFRPGAQASFYDPSGQLVAKGTVKSSYTDSVYVDIDPAGADVVDYGFVVLAGVPEAAAGALIREKRQQLSSVTAKIRNENSVRLEEIAAEARAERTARRQEQVAIERQRMDLDYEYDNGDWYGPPAGDPDGRFLAGYRHRPDDRRWARR